MSASHSPGQARIAVNTLRGKVVVSCQASPGHPFADPDLILALCRCAALGGAGGLRVDGSDAVKAARQATGLTVIGLRKVFNGPYRLSGGRPAITPELTQAKEIAAAGADIVAIEATEELHGKDLFRHVRAVRREIEAYVMADISTLDEGLASYEAGAHLVASTLSGYTAQSAPRDGPDLELVRALANRGVPVVAEGNISTPEHAVAALDAGAYFVVVGKAITDPVARTQAFVSAAGRTGGQR
jgi:N-acylglucosamine-6-phosphate 2-epimerase